jgi:hypothetical protein
MKPPLVLVAVLIHGICEAGPSVGALAAAKRIETSDPSVRWDRDTLVDGDFNADGRPDYAMVGYKGDLLILAVRASSAKGRKYRTDVQRFGIGPSIQAAICEAPAKLTVREQFCNPMDEPLPGCRPSAVARSLNLSGGDCDSIHLFWNHKRNRMEWWRL